MLKKIFSVRDNKVASYHTPFYRDNEINACRDLQLAVNDQSIQLSQYPEDFELFYLGEFNDVTGKFELLDNPKFIVAAVSFKKMIDKDTQK